MEIFINQFLKVYACHPSTLHDSRNEQHVDSENAHTTDIHGQEQVYYPNYWMRWFYTHSW
jgi:hypothetical protein